MDPFNPFRGLPIGRQGLTLGGLSSAPMLRQPFQSESDYFRANPHVAGMAAADDNVTLNPFTGLNPAQQDAVARNEFARIWMRQNGLRPEFALTPQQQNFFANTEYGKAPMEAKHTILARLLSGDSSAQDSTPEQRGMAYMLNPLIFGGR